MSEKLLPCPFCGGDAELVVGFHGLTDAKVHCLSCTAEGPLVGAEDASGGDHKAAAAAEWNNRTAPQSTQDGEAVALPGVFGVSRMADNEKAVLVSFREALTDEQLRGLHDALAHPSPAPSALAGWVPEAVYWALAHAEEFASATPHGDNCFLHDDGGEYDRCFCGKDSLLVNIERALEALPPAPTAASNEGEEA